MYDKYSFIFLFLYSYQICSKPHLVFQFLLALNCIWNTVKNKMSNIKLIGFTLVLLMMNHNNTSY